MPAMPTAAGLGQAHDNSELRPSQYVDADCVPRVPKLIEEELELQVG
jgi:hypothetical protein